MSALELFGVLMLRATLSVPYVLVLLAVLVSSYRLFLHPLRHFPGPTVAKVTNAYGAFYVWKQSTHLAVHRLHQRYGSAVRVAPNRLMFNSAEALQDIYNNARVVKGQSYARLHIPTNNGKRSNVFDTVDKNVHRRKRRIIGPVVSERSMRIFEPKVWSQIDVFLLQLLESSLQGEAVNMSPRFKRLSLDIIGQLAFGYSLNSQTEKIHRIITESLENMSDHNSLLYFSQDFSLFWKIVGWLKSKRDRNNLYQSIRTMIVARMAQAKGAHHDFYALASDDIGSTEPGLISEELWAEASLFIAAGGSTTSTALSSAFFYLSRSPEAYARLAHEIRTRFSSGRDIRNSELNGCKYLRAVIEETLRMSPPALTATWREQEPSSIASGENFVVDGLVIPPGTEVAISEYSLQHNPDCFPDPFNFKPDRWLAVEDNTHTADKKHDPHASMRRYFAPFSIGERSCIGRSLAYLELRLTVAKTIWYFDFKTAPGNAGKLGEDSRSVYEEFRLNDGIVVNHDGPTLVLTPRDDYIQELRVSEKDLN